MGNSTRPQTMLAATLVGLAASAMRHELPRLVDLGCGNGELLSTVRAIVGEVSAVGIDHDPQYRFEWSARRIIGMHGDFLQLAREGWLPGAEIYSLVNVLEGLAEPGELLSVLRRQAGARFLVCISPLAEAPRHIGQGGTWGWPMREYRALVRASGWPCTHEHRLVTDPVTGVTYQAILADDE